MLIIIIINYSNQYEQKTLIYKYESGDLGNKKGHFGPKNALNQTLTGLNPSKYLEQL